MIGKKYLFHTILGAGLYLTQTYALAKCVPFAAPSQNTVCQNTFGEKKLFDILKTNQILNPVAITFDGTQGVATKQNTDCIQLSDYPAAGEHFAVNENIQLSKGYNYFVFETKPTSTELYIYLIGYNSSILYSWLNAPIPEGGLSQFGDKNSIQPIFNQMETDNTSHKERFKLVIFSPNNQVIKLRWQHGQDHTTIYKSTTHASDICLAELGYIQNKTA